MMRFRLIGTAILLGSLSACGASPEINYTCDEPQRYQAISPGKKIQPPEGLDPLNEFSEMPIPRAQNAPARPPGSRCIELPPNIGTSS